MLLGGEIRKGEGASKVVVANEVTINLNVLHSLMENWIASNLDNPSVITLKKSMCGDKDTHVCQKPTKPHNLLRSGRHSPIPSLDTRSGNSLLSLAFSGDKRITNEDSKACSGAFISRVACPI